MQSSQIKYVNIGLVETCKAYRNDNINKLDVIKEFGDPEDRELKGVAHP